MAGRKRQGGLSEELDTHWKQWIPCSLLPIAFTGGKVGRCRGWRQIQVQIKSLVYFACSPVVFSSLFSNVLVGLFDCKKGGEWLHVDFFLMIGHTHLVLRKEPSLCS
jgi:hypothetical protein